MGTFYSRYLQVESSVSRWDTIPKEGQRLVPIVTVAEEEEIDREVGDGIGSYPLGRPGGLWMTPM